MSRLSREHEALFVDGQLFQRFQVRHGGVFLVSMDLRLFLKRKDEKGFCKKYKLKFFSLNFERRVCDGPVNLAGCRIGIYNIEKNSYITYVLL